MFLFHKGFHGFVDDEDVLLRFKLEEGGPLNLNEENLPNEFCGVVDTLNAEIVGYYSPGEGLTFVGEPDREYALCKVLMVDPEKLKKIERKRDDEFLVECGITPDW